ncbi:colicin V production family protein [Neorickettsia helminthoeca str. Oregon]|uniref:Colicin V production family protein n=2 Tax=Neorickettsia helminthoeca TaxID=33994 RepID=X5H568_9RICK|nr:colicin V production family protein [Neorickettsia helminthoeca str. Oregon]
MLRGSIKEIFSAAVIVISAMITYHNGNIFLEFFNVSSGPVVTPLSWIALFIISVVVLGLLNSWIMYLVSPIRLGPTDRVLGLLCGALRGVVYCYLIFAVLNIFYYSLNGDEEKDLEQKPGYYLPTWLKSAKAYSTLSYLDSSLNAAIPGEVFASLRSYSKTFKDDWKFTEEGSDSFTGLVGSEASVDQEDSLGKEKGSGGRG